MDTPSQPVGRLDRTAFKNYIHADGGSYDPLARWLDRLNEHFRHLDFHEVFDMATDRQVVLR